MAHITNIHFDFDFAADLDETLALLEKWTCKGVSITQVTQKMPYSGNLNMVLSFPDLDVLHDFTYDYCGYDPAVETKVPSEVRDIFEVVKDMLAQDIIVWLK